MDHQKHFFLNNVFNFDYLFCYFNIRQVITIPLKINSRLAGTFLIFNTEKENNVNAIVLQNFYFRK